eukprot:TRINITY_DN5844_c0_g1_i1.p1 TRINITY_DN5844_c0_g1~~TRINITY_DN5844_c0_g1_i1.p1  ORF type:complete len:326 (+),score=83.21 TRINITY_DN5844_c0_g1_i1:104-1081(+)
MFNVIGSFIAFWVFLFKQIVYYTLWPAYEDANRVFPGKTVLITGAASGMGKATTIELLRKGCNVIATDKNFEGLEALEKEVRGWKQEETRSVSMTIRKMDVSSQSEVDRVFSEFQVDYLVSNAGIGSMGPAVETPEEEYFKVFSINTLGTYRCAKAFVRQLQQRKEQNSNSFVKAHVVIVTSGSAHLRFPYQSSYAVSKAALEALADLLRLELREFGVRVSVVIPTAIETPIWDSLGATGSPLTQKYEGSRFLPGLLQAERFFRSMRPTALPAQRVADAVETVLREKEDSARLRTIVDATPKISRIFFCLPDWFKDYAIRLLMKQ